MNRAASALCGIGVIAGGTYFLKNEVCSEAQNQKLENVPAGPMRPPIKIESLLPTLPKMPTSVAEAAKDDVMKYPYTLFKYGTAAVCENILRIPATRVQTLMQNTSKLLSEGKVAEPEISKTKQIASNPIAATAELYKIGGAKAFFATYAVSTGIRTIQRAIVYGATDEMTSWGWNPFKRAAVVTLFETAILTPVEVSLKMAEMTKKAASTTTTVKATLSTADKAMIFGKAIHEKLYVAGPASLARNFLFNLTFTAIDTAMKDTDFKNKHEWPYKLLLGQLSCLVSHSFDSMQTRVAKLFDEKYPGRFNGEKPIGSFPKLTLTEVAEVNAQAFKGVFGAGLTEMYAGWMMRNIAIGLGFTISYQLYGMFNKMEKASKE